MAEYHVTLSGDSRAAVGDIKINYFGDEFVEVSTIPRGAFNACREGRFVPPAGEWGSATKKLGAYRTLILVAEQGSGRRTAALRALSEYCAEDKILEVQCSWKRLRTEMLPPPTRGYGYLLDLTESEGLPAETNFIGKLIQRVRQNDVFLTINTLESNWSDQLIDGHGDAIIRLPSPNARLLAESELQARGGGEFINIFANERFNRIWESSPKAEDVCRLARISARQPFRSADVIIEEYENWKVWIDKNLPVGLPSRSLMWSCAFCNGGRKKSILNMADDLRRETGENRTPSDALSEKPSSIRFAEANIEPDSDRVGFPPGKRGLASAIRQHLWEEYADQCDILTSWIRKQIGSLPLDDAERVATSAMALAIERHDDALLRAFRDAAVDRHPQLGISALSDAALDAKTGTHMRYQLYRWLDSSSQKIIDLVAYVCGAEFGLRMPAGALVRLRWAAQNSPPGREAVAEAANSIASRHPELVLGTIDGWLTQPNQMTAGINTFLALASRPAGAELLCKVSSESGFIPREQLGACFQLALRRQETREFAVSTLRSWEKFAERGVLAGETAIQVTGIAIAPWAQDNIMKFLFPLGDNSDLKTYRGQVLKIALETEFMSQNPQ